MKKHIPAVVLAILCLGLFIALQMERQKNARLMQNAVKPQAQLTRTETPPLAEQQAGILQTGMKDEIQPLAEASVPESDNGKGGNRRIMQNMAKTIEENPTINKMVEASQRGAIGALYADMIEYLDLDADETKYFMNLLMYRQMANVDAHMKMAAGNLTAEEKTALMEEVKLANETTRSEMEKFLNDAEDYSEFEFYEDTIGERMMLSQMDQMLGDDALGDETYREVLGVMYEERENYNWSTDLHDNENRDLSPERFSTENIRKHIADMKLLGEMMDQRMQEILTPEQLKAWRESGLAMQALMEGQLLQANQMFSGE